MLFERFDGFGEVTVKVRHAGGEEGIHHRTRKQTSEISLEEADQSRFTCFPANQQKIERM